MFFYLYKPVWHVVISFTRQIPEGITRKPPKDVQRQKGKIWIFVCRKKNVCSFFLKIQCRRNLRSIRKKKGTNHKYVYMADLCWIRWRPFPWQRSHLDLYQRSNIGLDWSKDLYPLILITLYPFIGSCPSLRYYSKWVHELIAPVHCGMVSP